MGIDRPQSFFIATNNTHKKQELQRIFSNSRIRLPEEAGVSFAFEEIGDSFLENAFGKAKALYKLIKQPVIADDSGLCVKTLNGKPGVYSARFGAEKKKKPLSTSERNIYLLNQMRDKTLRSACFVCCMVLILDDYRFFIAEETLEGEITMSPRGSGGFGYDPVFYLPEQGLTVAELSPRQKDEISHRGKAARAIAAMLDSIKTDV
ncbi:MAG: RdgB/HAM1 family non-canonical purine NTP pyrophosphatase [Spirochaetales bacterium]|nr:RdgB/HAM1 family non-canonical purine NTP pyrophosphatase [Spirochaetales bacterium]